MYSVIFNLLESSTQRLLNQIMDSDPSQTGTLLSW